MTKIPFSNNYPTPPPKFVSDSVYDESVNDVSEDFRINRSRPSWMTDE